MAEAILILFCSVFMIWGLPVVLGQIVEAEWRRHDRRRLKT